MGQEIQEAIQAGQNALYSLHLAQIKLNSAKSWSVLDKLSGSFLTSMMKYSKKADTQEYLEQARADMLCFQRKLKRINLPADIKMETSVFVSFATFFLDGQMEEYLLPSQIADTGEQIHDAIRITGNACYNLMKLCEIESCDIAFCGESLI